MKELLEGIAALLWPLIVIVVLLQFRPAVAAIIESARSRKFSLKIGGQELTMEEANEQLAKEVADIRQQLTEVKTKLSGETEVVTADELVDRRAAAPTRFRVLWVDDNPKNNSYLVAQLRTWDWEVDLALSTNEGLACLSKKAYHAVISDMGREEGGVFAEDAGLKLLRQVRTQNADVPFFIYCSGRGVHRWQSEVAAAGGNGITSSSTELLRMLQLNARKRQLA